MTTKVIAIATSCDFSVKAINHMLEISRNNDLGKAVNVYYNPLLKGQSFNEWGIVFEDGDCVFSQGT